MNSKFRFCMPAFVALILPAILAGCAVVPQPSIGQSSNSSSSSPAASQLPFGSAGITSIKAGGGLLMPDFSPLTNSYRLNGIDPHYPFALTVNAQDPATPITINGSNASNGVPFMISPFPAGSNIVIAAIGTNRAVTDTYDISLAPPSDFPAITVNVSSNPAPGYIFCGTFNGSATPYLMILDNSGFPVFYKNMYPGGGFDFKVVQDGILSYYDNNTREIVLLDSNYNEIRRVGAVGYNYPDQHEFRILSNGNFIYLVYHNRTNVDLTPYGGSNSGTIIDAVVQEVDTGGNVVFEWDSKDHISPADSLVTNYAPFDYIHANAIDMDMDGNLLLSSRHLSEIMKIRRNTNQGGRWARSSGGWAASTPNSPISLLSATP